MTVTQPGSPVRTDDGPAVDPTQNVLQLVEAAVKRLDDMRIAVDRRLDGKVHDEVEHLKELMALRADYTKQLSEAEAKRIDAIRAVDVNAVAVAAERSAAQATVLANQVAASAETLRTLVSQTATSIATNLASLTTQLTDRLALLEKTQYEMQGRAVVSNPADIARQEATTAGLAGLQKAISDLRETRSANVATVDQSKNIWALVLAVLGAFGVLVGIASYFSRATP